jgi:hypothetical protein
MKEKLDEATDKMYEIPVVVNFENYDQLTTQVMLLDPMPQIVEAVVKRFPGAADTQSPIAQVEIALKDATFELSEDVYLFVVKTPDKMKSDIIVAMNKADHNRLVDEFKVHVYSDLKKAILKGQIYPDPVDVGPFEYSPVLIGDTVMVYAPKTMPQIVEAKISESNVKLFALDRDVPFGHALLPIITPGKAPDAVVAVNADDLVGFTVKHGHVLVDMIEMALKEEHTIIVHNDIRKLVETPKEVLKQASDEHNDLLPALEPVSVRDVAVVEVPDDWPLKANNRVFEVVRTKPKSKKIHLQLIDTILTQRLCCWDRRTRSTILC